MKRLLYLTPVLVFTILPETFVIDRSGRVRHRHAGPLTEDIWHEVFEPLLAQFQVGP